jgi:frataxin
MMMQLVSSSRSVLRPGRRPSSSLVRCVSTREEGRIQQPERNMMKATQGSVRTLISTHSLTALSSLPNLSQQVRWFETEAEYHSVADEALEKIQDGIDDALDSTSIEYELDNASGVLTLSLPPHGTWVINKQTPNRQIWWSSPLSGPKRYEYDPEHGEWSSTKDSSKLPGLFLGPMLVQELRILYKDLEEFEINV